MENKAYLNDKKGLIQTVAFTVGFNTLFAGVLYEFVLPYGKFFDIFVISQFIGLSICLWFTVFIHRRGKKGKGLVVAGVFPGLIVGILSGSFLSWVFLYASYDIEIAPFFRNVFFYTTIFGVLFGVPVVYFFTSVARIRESEARVADERIKRLSLEKDSALTRLQLLQAQIEPHFLFNTLANVIVLLDEDPARGKDMLVDINTYLKIAMQRTRQDMITLKQELELVRRYLNIFKIRLGERLSFEIHHAAPDDLPFPPLIIQPLVENAVKYGIAPEIKGGSIRIETSVKEKILRIVVSDTGGGANPQAAEAGMGINNVSRRLHAIYGNRSSLLLTANKPSGTKAIVEAPCE